MAKAKVNTDEKIEVTVEKRLKALYELQQIDTQIDKIKILRGELPLEVEDLEDEVEGLKTRLEKFKGESKEIEATITEKKNFIKDCEALVAKYEEQQNNVRNNREFESLSKEIEFQKLEIQLSEKRIKEAKFQITQKKEMIEEVESKLAERMGHLKSKKEELDEIITSTQKDEENLLKKSDKAQKQIEDRLLVAYKRIRNAAKNGLAVVTIERDACGGCFSKIPPQRQADVKLLKKVIVCEYCGRILVDPALVHAEVEA
jgi:uncharacterized protein